MLTSILNSVQFSIFIAVSFCLAALYTLFFSLLSPAFQSSELVILSFIYSLTTGFFVMLNTLKFLQYFGRSKHKIIGFFIAIYLGGMIISLDRFTNVFSPLRSYETNLMFRLKAGQLTVEEVSDGAFLETVNQDAHPAIQIIAIDNNTVNKFGGYPFSWKYYSQLLEALSGSELRAVLFDIFFLDRKKDDFGLESFIDNIKSQTEEIQKGRKVAIDNRTLAANSQRFSDSVKKFKKVIIDYAFESEVIMDQNIEELKQLPEYKELDKLAVPDINIIDTEFNKLPDMYRFPHPPLYEVISASMGAGAANIPYTGDEANQWMPMVIQWQGKLYPTFPLLAACSYLRIKCPRDMEVKLGSHITLKRVPDIEMPIGVTGEFKPLLFNNKALPEIKIPINGQGMMRINFIGGAYSFPRVSMAQILEDEKEFPGSYGSENPLYFRNKLLLVAMYYATGVAADVHPSPFGNIAGIEHHANAINTILMQNFITEAPQWIEYTMVMFFAVLFGLLIPRLQIREVFLGSLLFALILLIESLVLFSTLNISHTVLILIFENFVILLAIIAHRVLAEEENVKYVRNTFSKFVSKDVVNELLNNPESIELGGGAYDMTVFFSDIRGFTTISEKLPPEELVQVLNEYLSSMTNIIIEERGAIDKYIGDAIMAFWGAPVPDENHALLACRASLRQLESLKALQEKWSNEGKPVLDIGIGLNTGLAVAGNIGSEHRMDYTIIGDMVNLGSRIEGINKVYGTRIIISENTYEAVKGKVQVRELDYIRVKGKKEPVKIYELLALA